MVLNVLKKVVGEDGSVVIRVYLLDPNNKANVLMVHLSTDGYMLLAETKPIKPGDWSKQELAVKNHLFTLFHIQQLIQKQSKT